MEPYPPTEKKNESRVRLHVGYQESPAKRCWRSEITRPPTTCAAFDSWTTCQGWVCWICTLFWDVLLLLLGFPLSSTFDWNWFQWAACSISAPALEDLTLKFTIIIMFISIFRAVFNWVSKVISELLWFCIYFNQWLVQSSRAIFSTNQKWNPNQLWLARAHFPALCVGYV